MSDDLKIEYILLKIREKLNKDKVKLWLPPYSSEQNDQKECFQELIEKYSTELRIERNVCSAAMSELQRHAINKLKEREVFQETGVAVIKIKVSGASSKVLSVNMSLSDIGRSLQQSVAGQLSLPLERVKLISSGKVLKDNMTLELQGVKHGSQIMAIILSPNSQDVQEYEMRLNLLEKTKDDVKLLSNRKNHEFDHYLQIADQTGKTLDLPSEERNALVTAMTLHEKGRAAMKKEDYGLALVLLLEADKEFSHCNSELLKSVDNYGLLNLDIAWCYLCLKNVTQIPDAESRLKICETKFKFSYGPNLERVVALKGSSGNEAALLMRLHLLQGIVLFHQNKPEEARRILGEAQHELALLKVDDASFSMLIELGLTPAEARLGLRATRGQVDAAVEFIHQKRAERDRIKKSEEEEREKKRLGRCLDGKYVEPNLLKSLVNMGFSKELAVEALKRTNNVIADAICMIQRDPDALKMANSSFFKSLVKQVAGMGYEFKMAKLALKKHNGNIEKAIEDLVTNNGFIEGIDLDDSDDDDDVSRPSTSSTDSKRRKEEQDAFNRISEGLSTGIEDHLDLTLEHEEQFLLQYLSLLS